MKNVLAGIMAMVIAASICACAQKTPTWQEQYELGVRYLSEGNYEEAIIAFTSAIEIDSKMAPAYVGRGDAYVGIAQSAEEYREPYAAAETDYLAALDLDELLEDVYTKLADIYVTLGEVKKAISILELGYEKTGNESFLERIDALKLQPDMSGMRYHSATIVTMYEADDIFVGHDVYTFDTQGRMLSVIWYDQDNAILYSESWIYDDAAGQTEVTKYQLKYDDVGADPIEETEIDTIVGCEDQGWYWDDMGDFSTDPTMETDDGTIELDDGRLVQYGYDGQGRVASIYTYNDDVLIGYCIVTYA